MTDPTTPETGEGHPSIVRPYLPKPSREGRVVGRVSPVGPVTVRLIGRPDDIAMVLAVLTQAATVTNITDPRAAREPGHVRVYATVTRRFPLTGGIR